MDDTHTLVMKSNEIVKDLTIDGSTASEALKASNLVNAKAQDCILIGGSEDCLDVVRGYGEFVRIKFKPSKNTKQAVTVKGGASVSITSSEFVGKSKKYDIVIGDFTIYDAVDSNRRKADVTIGNCKAYNDDGSERPVKILILKGKLINNSRMKVDVKVTKYPSLLVNLYFFFSKLFLSKKRKQEAKENLKNSPDVIE